MRFHWFVYEAEDMERFARLGRFWGWRIRFLGFSLGRWGVYFVRRTDGVRAAPGNGGGRP